MTTNLLRCFFTGTLLLAFTVSVSAEPITVLTSGSVLMRSDSVNPAGILGAPLPITGMAAGDSMFAIDFRPIDGVLVGLGYNSGAGTGRVYSIDTTSGVATQIQPVNLPMGMGLTQFGFDFNPSANALRIIDSNGNNFRITSGGTGTVFSDTTINPAGNNLVALAYSNNVAGAASTVLFGAEANAANLVTVSPPNSGAVNSIGPLGIVGSRIAGFDISGTTAMAYLSIASAGPGDSHSRLFNVNLATGAATEVMGTSDGTGRIGGGLTIRDFSVLIVPEPSTSLLIAVAAAGLFIARRTRRLKYRSHASQ